jgi:hypothetical protein
MPESSVISIRLSAMAGKAEGLKIATLEPQLGRHPHGDDVVHYLGKAFDPVARAFAAHRFVGKDLIASFRVAIVPAALSMTRRWWSAGAT